MNPEMETRIRSLANRFWEDEGRPEGKEQEHWRRARDQLAAGKGGKSDATWSDGRSGDSPGRSGDPDGAQSGMTKEEVFLKSTTRLTPD